MVYFTRKKEVIMGYSRQTSLTDAYIADTVEDLASLPKSTMGSVCWVISEGIEYICNSKNKWLPRHKKTTAPEELANYYTKQDIDSQLQSIPRIALTENEIKAIILQNSKGRK
jgi:hypothetical protein